MNVCQFVKLVKVWYSYIHLVHHVVAERLTETLQGPHDGRVLPDELHHVQLRLCKGKVTQQQWM